MKVKLKIYLQLIEYFFIDCTGWVNSLFIYVFRSIKKPAIIYGYASYFWGCKYADKRSNNWKSFWDQSGKQQGIFPVSDTKLLVCSKMELNIFKRKKIISKSIKPRKMILKSYYTTII